MYDTNTVKEALDALEAGLTEAEAAELVGVSRRTVNSWRRGNTPHERKAASKRRRWRPTPEVLERMKAMRHHLGLTYAEIAERVGCCRDSAWKHLGGSAPGSPPAGGAGRREDAGMEDRDDGTGAPAGGAQEEIAALKRRIRQLEMENDVMREVLGVLKADPRSLGRGLTNREKAEVARRLKGAHPVAGLCALLQIARSTCYYLWGHPAPEDPDADIRGRVVEAFEQVSASRGYRCIKHVLDSDEATGGTSEKRILGVMGQEGLRVVYSRHRRRGARGDAPAPAPPNLVRRDFRAGLPNYLWLTDVTEFKLPSGSRVYLSPVLDCFDGKPVSWRMGTRADSELSDGCLLDAIAQRSGDEKTVIHDDRGSLYRSHSWIGICERHGIARSMSAAGCSPDNSAMEGFFGNVKNEFSCFRDWKGVGTGEFMERLDAYLRYYCEKRPKESLGWMSPDEYRRSLGMAC